MKNKILLSLSFAMLLLTSCYKDNSNSSWQMINPIIVDFDGQNGKNPISLNGFMFEELIVDPIVYKEGTKDTAFSFEWTISGTDIKTEVVGNRQAIKLVLKYPPQISPYNLVLKITDNETKIERFVKFLIKVQTSFAEGLVIADTRDEKSTDLHLVISQAFNSTMKYGEDKVYNNIYSQVNGAPIDGLVKDLQTKSYQTNRTLTALTEHGVIRTDHYDYKRINHECDLNVFTIAPEQMSPQKLFLEADTGNEYMICGDRLYHRTCNDNNRKYGYYMFISGRTDCRITKGFTVLNLNAREYYKSWFWDDTQKGFLLCQYGKLTAPMDQSSELFDVNHMDGLEPLFFGHIKVLTELHMIMKETSTGKLFDYVVNTNQVDNGSNLPNRIIDISETSGIDKAKIFTCNVLENRLYHTDGKSIFSISLANNIVTKQYDVADPNEVITNIEVCNYSPGRIRYKDLRPTSVTGYLETTAKNRMMLVTIYNEATKEGKLVIVPIPVLNGELEQDRNFHITYGGYGRILKVAKQDK